MTEGRQHRHSQRRMSVALVLLVMLMLALRSVVSAQSQPALPTPTPLPLFALPDARANAPVSSSTIALGKDTLTMAAANMLSDSVTFLVPSQGKILGEVPVGKDPRSVAITPNGLRALVANRGDDTLSVINVGALTVTATIPLGGVAPYGVVANDRFAYVSLEDSDEIVAVDLSTGQVAQRLPVADAPSGLALWGDFLYVTHFWSGQITLVYVPQWRVIGTVSTGTDTGLSQSLQIDPVRGVAYLPQTRSNAQNVHLTFDTTVFPIVNTVDLRALTLNRPARVSLDTADRPVNLPFAVAYDGLNNWLYVANAGSNDVSVIDLRTGLARNHFDVGANPRSILLNRDTSLAYVHNVLDATITIIDTRKQTIVQQLPISNITLPNDQLIGAQLFNSAADPRLSQDKWISCATCHFDGGSDGRVWAGFPDGPRNTPVLYGLAETAPYNWSSTWDEIADVELKIRWLQGGTGLIEGQPSPPLDKPNAGRSPDLDTLASYILSFSTLPAPTQDAAQVARGQQVFVEQNCASCHVGQVGSNLQSFDVGTGLSPLEKHGTSFDTPSLRWLWLSAPYFHDGSAPSLRQLFEQPGKHQLLYTVSPQDIDALVAYLLSIPESDIPKSK